MGQRSPFVLAAVALLVTAAFGGLSVGVPLTFALVTDSTIAALGPETGIVPIVALVYGAASLVGAVGVWLGRPWSTVVVVVPQGLVTVALLAVYLLAAADWSLLAVAAISGGAAVCVLADRRPARRR